MSPAAALIAELHSLGVSVSVEGGNLHFRPRARVTAGLIDRARRHKAEIVQAIRLDRLATLDDDHLDAWAERIAICTVDGGLSEEEAQEIAWSEIECCSYAKKI